VLDNRFLARRTPSAAKPDTPCFLRSNSSAAATALLDRFGQRQGA
jgi:hypothetical protein